MHQGLHAAQPVAPRRPDLTDAPIFPAQCTARPAVQHARHEVRARRQPATPRRGAPTVASYDPRTGIVDGAVDANGNPVRFRDQGNLSILGGDSWKWLLVGPVANP